MTRITVEVDGYTYEGHWLSTADRGLHVRGPLEYRRQTTGYYSRAGDWTDDSGPQGRRTERHVVRWWRAARLLVERYEAATTTYRVTTDIEVDGELLESDDGSVRWTEAEWADTDWPSIAAVDLSDLPCEAHASATYGLVDDDGTVLASITVDRVYEQRMVVRAEGAGA